MDRKNINRGFKKLRVWQDAVSLYVLACKMKVYTFMGRLIRHIPDKHFPMIRYAGVFSNRWRKQYLAQARIALNQSDEPDDCDGNAQPLWAQRQTDYTGIDPLQCPNCDKPLTF